ncbi:hypothetical protein HAX54_035932 [Datura stramonium]|uniref:Uncharacterized protein n=1 Tax=Datura stramonium TaxID=4076 RepID=A0ABS8VG24_DATST|nr:hypothetical protein [Datura stramonium]
MNESARTGRKGLHDAAALQRKELHDMDLSLRSMGTEKNFDIKVDEGSVEECKVGDDVVVKCHVDIANKEAVVGLKGKEKVKEKVEDIAKSLSPISKPLPPFPPRLMEKTLNAKIDRHIERLKEATLRERFIDAIKEMPSFSKYFKELLTKKRPFEEEVVSITHGVKGQRGCEAKATKRSRLADEPSDSGEEYQPPKTRAAKKLMPTFSLATSSRVASAATPSQLNNLGHSSPSTSKSPDMPHTQVPTIVAYNYYDPNLQKRLEACGQVLVEFVDQLYLADNE